MVLAFAASTRSFLPTRLGEEPIKISTVGSGTEGASFHGTTRGHQRHVVYYNNTWFVFYSGPDVGSVYVSSDNDGDSWTSPWDTGHQFHPFATSSSYDAIVQNDKILLFHTNFTLPDNANNGDWVVVREGLMNG
ncbi:MAG: hypothetical protein V3R93_07530, partial [Candidatus Hydrothermarchaeaceae archaeon]